MRRGQVRGKETDMELDIQPIQRKYHLLFLESFGKRQSPHKSVNVSFFITNVKNKLMDLCGN